jgi:hypothetical protein
MERRMLRHKATIQGARVAFGFSGITDEDEARETPGLANARDVTPKTAARATPLDPFASLPETFIPHEEESAPVVEAQVVDQPDPDMDDPALLDFLDQIQGCEDAAALTKLVKPANDGFEGAKQAIAKRAISAKAGELGVKWVGTKEKGEFKA